MLPTYNLVAQLGQFWSTSDTQTTQQIMHIIFRLALLTAFNFSTTARL